VLGLVVLAAALVVPAAAHASDGSGSGGVVGGEIRVGLRVVVPGHDGSVSYEPGDHRAPSPVRVEATMRWSSPPGIPIPATCVAGGGPALNGFVYDVTIYDTATGAVLSTQVVCVPVAVPGPGTGDSALPAPPTITEIWGAAGIPAPPIGVSPAQEGVVGLATWLWSGGPQQVPVAVTIRGWTVTGVATVGGYRFDPGDGTIVAGAIAGSLDAPAATHVYDVKATYALGVASVWDATVTMTGPGLTAPVPVAIGTAVVGATRNYRVVEVRSTLVR
jgi:hypothetical protein